MDEEEDSGRSAGGQHYPYVIGIMLFAACGVLVCMVFLSLLSNQSIE